MFNPLIEIYLILHLKDVSLYLIKLFIEKGSYSLYDMCMVDWDMRLNWIEIIREIKGNFIFKFYPDWSSAQRIFLLKYKSKKKKKMKINMGRASHHQWFTIIQKNILSSKIRKMQQSFYQGSSGNLTDDVKKSI